MVTLPEIEKDIEQIRQKVSKCKKCNLWKTRSNPVFGEGYIKAKIMFIGEAPGKNEDKQGRPFVGKAGKILDELLHTVKLERKQVYICNILKCRPPKNRNPKVKEIEKCTLYLDYQISRIKPLIIATLGNFASSYIMEKFGLQKEKIGNIHGKLFHIKKRDFNTTLIPLYHPAAAIYNPNKKGVLIKDFKSINKAPNKPKN